MIPQFPAFKKLELSDKEEVEAFTSKIEPYSDFEFGSLWAWDIQEETALSWLRGNLVVRFTDYVTREPFYSFLGDNAVNETAALLIEHSKKDGIGNLLGLVPEVVASKLDSAQFIVAESREHFDYIYELEHHIAYNGGKLKSRRNFLNGFQKNYIYYNTLALDLSDAYTQERILSLCKKWEENKGYPIPNEVAAHARFLKDASKFNYSTTGITVDSELIGFCTTILMPGTNANALFEKTDTAYHGVHAALRSEVARELRRKGYTHLNYEQDLGIASLRQSKMAFNPSSFLKKYNVSLRSDL